MTQLKINASQPITEEDGTMSQLFRQWTIQVSNNLPIVGTGSPEGVVEAPQYSLYIDETVPLVPVQYRKMLPSVTNDRSQGWAVV
jgi:hypothetical protein